jgi:hypothetical protein
MATAPGPSRRRRFLAQPMPLHREGIPVAVRLDGLDDAIVGLGRYPQPRAKEPDGLMVTAVHPEPANPEDVRQPGLLINGHVMLGRCVGRPTTVPGQSLLRGQVLPERPAGRDIEHLHAAAYRQHREPVPRRPAGDRQLSAIQFGLELIPRWHQRRLAIEVRTHVATSRQEYPIAKSVQHLELGGRYGRQRQRHAPTFPQQVKISTLLHDPLRLPGTAPGPERHPYNRLSHQNIVTLANRRMQAITGGQCAHVL